MAGTDEVLDVWKEWSIQVLVLLSFTLQVTLLIFAELRRRIDSGILRFFVWSAYMLADGTAIYVLGHMSVTSRLPEHGLMAFWAPFLLLHLGGQDNITAYAIEDNQLWLRHLQTLVVQVAIVGYIIYLSLTIHSPALLWWATILMFVVGVTKYGERVWALRCAGSSPMGKNYRTFQYYSEDTECQYYLDTMLSPSRGPWDTEAYLLMAHRMMQVPKELLQGPIAEGRAGYPLASYMCEKDVYMVAEMQLSLMHDVFYTKTEMIHSNLYGLCIHILPAMATATAFLLFHILITLKDHGKEDKGYNRLDVAVTYVLSIGAVVLETTSLLRSMFSSWTCPLLVRWSRDHCGMEDHTLCNHLASILTSLRRLVHAAEWRRKYWSRSMGQHNLLQLGARSRASSIRKISRWMGFEDWWNTLAYSWSIPVSSLIEELLVKQVFMRKGKQSHIPRGRRLMPPYHLELDGEVRRSRREEEAREKEEERGKEEEEEEKEEKKEEEEEEEEEEETDDIEEVLVRELDDLRDEEEEAGAEEGLESRLDIDHHLFDSKGRAELKRWGLYVRDDDGDGLSWSIEERILVWHIATSIYLGWWYKMKNTKQAMAEAIEALSNYMMFLLAARPYMLSPTASRNGYVELCYGLITRGPPYSSVEELANKLQSYGGGLLDEPDSIYTLHRQYDFGTLDFTTQTHLRLILQTGCKLGAKLIRNAAADTQEVIAQVWVEALCYAAQQCSADSHAKQLGSGGELITIAAILVRYTTQVFRHGGPSRG